MSSLPVAKNPITTRSPVMVWLVFPLITLGIYQLYWYYKVHEEMARFRQDPTAPVAGPLLVILLLSWTIIAPFISIYNTGNRIRQAQQAAGMAPSCNAVLGVVLMFFFGLWTLYYQTELNKIPAATAGAWAAPSTLPAGSSGSAWNHPQAGHTSNVPPFTAG